MNAMLSLDIVTLLEIWAEFVECYWGHNKYGGHTAEIYAYRFWKYKPIIDQGPIGKMGQEALEDRAALGANCLVEICQEFQRAYECTVEIDGLTTERWQATPGTFDHRAHVRVIHGRNLTTT